MPTLEERAAKKQAELKELNARIAKKKALEKKKERAQRTQALIELGGVVLNRLQMDWTEIDPAVFDQDLEHIAGKTYAEGTPIFNCRVEKQEPKAAHERFQQFAKMQRDKWKENR